MRGGHRDGASVDEQRPPAPQAPRDVHTINFSWLVQLRWWAIAGQVAIVLAVHYLVGVALSLTALLLVVGVEAASNIGCALLARGRRAPRESWLVAAMVFDTLVLTALLYFSGGPLNPFSFLYLVQIALAAVVLRARWTWTLVVLSLACSALLFVTHEEVSLGHHGEHMRLHLQGMWLAFGVAAAFIVYFLLRVTAALAARDVDLAAMRERAARQEKLASLATLAAGAAHELSTPLSTIAVVAKELEHQLTSMNAAADVVTDVALIRAQVLRCRSILEQMATDAGASAGESPSRVLVRDLIADATSALSPAPPISVEMGDDTAATTLHLPSRAFAQALRGLVRNAQDASEQATPVRVRVNRDGDALRFSVEDDGSGMSPDVLRLAGEPFFTTKEPGRGMGLGVFLARAVIERLGGRLALASQPGRGTTATVELPLVEGAKILRMAGSAET